MRLSSVLRRAVALVPVGTIAVTAALALAPVSIPSEGNVNDGDIASPFFGNTLMSSD